MELTGMHSLMMFILGNSILFVGFVGVIVYCFARETTPRWRDIGVTTCVDDVFEPRSSWFRVQSGTIFTVKLDNHHPYTEWDIALAIKTYGEELGYVVTEVAVEGRVIENVHKG